MIAAFIKGFHALTPSLLTLIEMAGGMVGMTITFLSIVGVMVALFVLGALLLGLLRKVAGLW